MERIKKEFNEYRTLMRNVPAVMFTLFVIAIVMMNLVANKSINLPWNWIGLNCGIVASWLSFLAMDTLTRRYGPKAATEISLTALAVNWLVSIIFYVCAKISGMWGMSFAFIDNADIVNAGLDGTFAGAWYVVFGSSVAFIVSALVNNFLNHTIGKKLKDKVSFKNYALRSYPSTLVGQLLDNLIFSFMVSHVFFGWTTTQCITCSIFVALLELAFEIVFSPLGFRVVRSWEKHDVGKEYLELVGR